MNAIETPKQPGIQIDQIFVSRAHFEHGPLAVQLPLGSPIPPIRFGVQYESRRLDGDGTRAAGVLRVSSVDPDPFFYQVSVELTALVSVIQGERNLKLEDYMSQPLVATLYPFAREAVAAITGRGRHGAIYLKPFNVGALFAAAATAAPDKPTRQAARKKK